MKVMITTLSLKERLGMVTIRGKPKPKREKSIAEGTKRRTV